VNEKRSAERVRGTASSVLPRAVTGANNLLSRADLRIQNIRHCRPSVVYWHTCTALRVLYLFLR